MDITITIDDTKVPGLNYLATEQSQTLEEYASYILSQAAASGMNKLGKDRIAVIESAFNRADPTRQAQLIAAAEQILGEVLPTGTVISKI